MSWRQFTTSDRPQVNKFLTGLQTTRAALSKADSSLFVYALDGMPQAEGWIFDNGTYELGLIMCHKPTISVHAVLWSYATGTITREAIFLAMMEKMNDYVSGHGGSTYRAAMVKDGINKFAGFTETNARAALGGTKTLTVLFEDALSATIEITPK